MDNTVTVTNHTRNCVFVGIHKTFVTMKLRTMATCFFLTMYSLAKKVNVKNNSTNISHFQLKNHKITKFDINKIMTDDRKTIIK